MITIFNRKELFITTDMNYQAKLREILAARGIDYAVKVKNLQGAYSRARGGSFGINHDAAYEYKIYVRKKDYDKALTAIL